MSLRDRCSEKIGNSLFEKAMKEFREQQDQAKQKVETKNKCYHIILIRLVIADGRYVSPVN